MHPPKTKAQRQQESAAALVRQRQREEEEYYRRLALPSIDDKLNKIGEAIAELAVLIGGEDAAVIATELLQYLEQETQ